MSSAKELSVDDMQEYDNIEFMCREDNVPGVILYKEDSKVWTPILLLGELCMQVTVLERETLKYSFFCVCVVFPFPTAPIIGTDIRILPILSFQSF